MSVTVRLTGALRRLTGGQSRIETAPGSVGATLKAVCTEYAALRARLLLEDGSLRPDTRLFVAEDDIRALSGLETPVADGQVVSVMLPVAGA